MSLDPFFPFLGAWAVIGGGIGLAMIDSFPGEETLWSTGNWAQRLLLLFAFGPLLWLLVPGAWIAKRTLVPVLRVLWAWLGRL